MPKTAAAQLIRLRRVTLLVGALWTGLLALSLWWNHSRETVRILQLADIEAKTSLQKDLAFRRWATLHGGLYVAVSPAAQPSPYMGNVPERDVATPSGRTLTLYNPALILRLLMDTQRDLYGIRARITGEQYLNPVNAPDPWERKALGIVGRTLDDYSEVTTLDGAPVLRRMQPMIMEEGCLKCHAWTGIPVGALRGATDVAIPLQPYFELGRQSQQALALSHGGIWLLGAGFLAFFHQRRRSALIERSQHEAMLRKLHLAVEESASGILITDHEGRIEFANRKLSEICGYTPAELLGQTPKLFKSGETDPEVYRQMWARLSAGAEWRGEFKNRRKSGAVYWCLETISPIKDDAGAITHYVAVLEDVSARKDAEFTIRRLAFYDALTELPNRRLLAERVLQAVARHQRDQLPLALMYLDLDRFKTINDTLGHHAGDRLLKAAAQRLQPQLRDTDTLARLGGDEFAILVSAGPREASPAVIAQRLLEAMQPPFELDGQELVITTSIGISLYPKDTDDVDTLFRNADVAMYQAKRLGKNTYCFFDPQLNAQASERLLLETGLRRALAHHELFLEYQPKQVLASGLVDGAEALVRWRHPERGRIPPDRFIPLAEEIGEIDRIGDWVLREACRQAQRWQAAGHALTVSVNVSPLQFRAADLAARVAAALADSGLPPARLELEITESGLMDDPERTRATLAALHALGVSCSIDDFGTGYSSLSHLKQFKVSTLKIDRTFVRDIIDDSDDRSIATAVIALARSLGLDVIAEGVETAEQRRLLEQLGCDRIQGYLLSRPLPPDAFEAWLARLPRSS